VVAPNWIGDALMAQPLFARLHEKLPGIAIDALAPPWVTPVLERMPEIDRVIPAPFRHGALQLRERWRLAQNLRGAGYRQAIVLPNSWKSALVPYFADIPVRSGYVGESRYGLLNLLYRREQGRREPMITHYARLAERPGSAPPESLPPPLIAADRETARATAARFGIAPERRLVVLCPGAEYGPAKRWPPEYFGAFARTLPPQGVDTIALGSAADAAACRAVEQASGGRVNSLAGRTTLGEAIDLIALAALVVSNDSGLMHLAAALQRPQIALFGSSSPEHTPPRSEQARVLWLGLDCSPCFKRDCPLGHFRCMRDLGVERVVAEARALAAETGVLPSGAAAANV